MAIPNPNPNIADGIQCDNLTWSSNKIKSVIDTVSGALPTPEAGDAGKVLTVNAGATGYEIDNIPEELPTPEAGDAGKVLTVNSDATGYELSSKITKDLLFTNESGVPSTCELSHAFTDYDFLCFDFSRNTQKFNEFVLVNTITLLNEWIFSNYDTDYLAIQFTDSTTISKISVSGNINLFNIYGIKF